MAGGGWLVAGLRSAECSEAERGGRGWSGGEASSSEAGQETQLAMVVISGAHSLHLLSRYH